MPSFLNLQSRNVCTLISVTLLEITTEVKPVQWKFVAYIDNQLVARNKVEKS